MSSATERMLISLIGRESTQKIIEHPNLHVVSLPEHMVQDLVEGTVMIVPVGKLCDLCDLPEANKFCQCETETIVDDEGFTITTKRRPGTDDMHTAVSRYSPDGYNRGPAIPTEER